MQPDERKGDTRSSQVVQRNVACGNGDSNKDERDEEDQGTCRRSRQEWFFPQHTISQRDGEGSMKAGSRRHINISWTAAVTVVFSPHLWQRGRHPGCSSCIQGQSSARSTSSPSPPHPPRTYGAKSCSAAGYGRQVPRQTASSEHGRERTVSGRRVTGKLRELMMLEERRERRGGRRKRQKPEGEKGGAKPYLYEPNR
eukprot:758153-Hanusia_phi.AAC.1